MKKLFKIITLTILLIGIVTILLVKFIGKQRKSEMNQSQCYDLIINGYDWGPAVDKIVLHGNKNYQSDEINIDDFIIETETYGYNWTSWPPAIDLKKGNRIIKNAYLCDENGNEIKNKSSFISLELSVHPDDMFSNPFLYGSDMMNHWQEKYEVSIINEKLKINTSLLNKKICPLADKFMIGKSKKDDVELSYALWKPESNNKKNPLIIWLHGMGEGGTDPYIALLGNKVVNLITEDVQKYFSNGAFVLVPQVNGFWMQTRIDAQGMEGWISETSELTKSYYTEALFNLINEVVENNPEIDCNRIYIGGCSNGGYMTINMLLEYPDYFAAAYPVCMAYPDSQIDDDKLNILSKQHIWFTQSMDDKTVDPVKYILPLEDRLREVNSEDIHLSMWENVVDTTGNYKRDGNPYYYNGHFSWIYVLNNQCKDSEISLFEWLSKISK